MAHAADTCQPSAAARPLRTRPVPQEAAGLSMIRKAAELTQTEVATRLGVKQTSVSRLEVRPDMLMSTLRNYLDAAGAEHPRIVVPIAGADYEVDLDAFA